MAWFVATAFAQPPRRPIGPRRAEQIIVTVSGTVDTGTDGIPAGASDYPAGTGNVFGGGSNLSGPFTLTFSIDDSQSDDYFGICPDGSIYSSSISTSNAVVGRTATAVLQIGSGAFSYGTFTSGIGWGISKAAAVPCYNGSSSLFFSWGESYTGNYLGDSGFGVANLTPVSNFASGDWRVAVPSVSVVGSAPFIFYIKVYEGGTLTKWAAGNLTPETLTVSGPLTCGAGTLSPPPDPDGVPHSYVVTDPICSTSDSPSCTRENVYSRLRLFPTTVPEVQPVNTCDVTYIPGVGNVIFYVNPSNLSVTNVTLPNHLLYPGQVIRAVIQEGDTIFIQTTGTGTGRWPELNGVAAAVFVWPIADGLIAAPYNSTPDVRHR